jgi:hypothetical protein
MRIDFFDKQIAAVQLSLLFDIEAIFTGRGRRVASYGNKTELLFDPDLFDSYPLMDSAHLDGF